LLVNDGDIPALDLDSPDGTDPATGVSPTILGEGDLEPNTISLQIYENETAVTDDVFRITFDPNGGLDVDQQNLTLPVTIAVSAPANSATQRCVIVSTLLGATRVEQDEACTPN
jgi:hypothetical protein